MNLATDTTSARDTAAMTPINRRFLLHYGQMVLVMFAGMAVLGMPAGWVLGAFGSSWSELQTGAPAGMLTLMAFTMTAPMVWWMARMGHSIRANAEMAASMIVPTIAAIALLAADAVRDTGTVLIVEHVAMLIAMFAVMLARPEEYSGHHHHQAATA